MEDIIRGKITKEMIACANDAATGDYTIEDLAEKYHKSCTSIRRWLRSPGVQEVYRSVLRAAEVRIVARARRKIDKSMNSDNEYLAFQAAQYAISRYEDAVMGEDRGDVVVRLVSGELPKIGMPQRSDDD